MVSQIASFILSLLFVIFHLIRHLSNLSHSASSSGFSGLFFLILPPRIFFPRNALFSVGSVTRLQLPGGDYHRLQRWVQCTHPVRRESHPPAKEGRICVFLIVMDIMMNEVQWWSNSHTTVCNIGQHWITNASVEDALGEEDTSPSPCHRFASVVW